MTKPPLKLPGESILDKLLAFILDKKGKIKLSDKLQERYDRSIVADNLLLLHGSDFSVADMLVTRYKYDKATAYRDIDLAKKLWGSQRKFDKEYNRNLLWHYNLEGYRDARAAGDHRSAAAFLANLNKLGNFDKNDPDMPEWDKFIQNNNILIIANPEDVGLERMPDVDKMLNQFKSKKQKTIDISSDNG